MRLILILFTLQVVLPFYSHVKMQRKTYLTALREPLQKNYDDMDIFERFEKHSEERNWVKQNEYLWKIYYKINNITEPNSLLKWGEIN